MITNALAASSEAYDSVLLDFSVPNKRPLRTHLGYAAPKPQRHVLSFLLISKTKRQLPVFRGFAAA